MITNKYKLSAGVGTAKTVLTSFDAALINAQIANYNLVKISSILPVKAERVDEIELAEGSVLFTAFASVSTECADDIVAAAVAVGIPKDETKVGVIVEYSCHGTKVSAEKKAREMITEAMNMRGYEINKVLVEACEAYCDGKNYTTAFAGLAMW